MHGSEVTFGGIVSDVSFLHQWKHFAPMDVIVVGISIDVNEEQKEKQFLGSDDIVVGIWIDRKLKQSSKQFTGNDVTVVCMIIDVSDLKFFQQPEQILVKFAWISIDFNELHP